MNRQSRRLKYGLFSVLFFGIACGSSSKDKPAGPSEGSSGATVPSIEWTECQYPNIPGKLRCGVLRVYENREAREGRVLELKFVILPARREPAAPDPVFSIYGGRGRRRPHTLKWSGKLPLASIERSFFSISAEQARRMH